MGLSSPGIAKRKTPSKKLSHHPRPGQVGLVGDLNGKARSAQPEYVDLTKHDTASQQSGPVLVSHTVDFTQLVETLICSMDTLEP